MLTKAEMDKSNADVPSKTAIGFKTNVSAQRSKPVFLFSLQSRSKLINETHSYQSIERVRQSKSALSKNDMLEHYADWVQPKLDGVQEDSRGSGQKTKAWMEGS